MPALWPGDVLIATSRAAHEIELGDIALFARGDRLVVHRVVTRDGALLATSGDAAVAPDAPLDAANVIGVVERVLRRGRLIRPTRRPGLAARALSFVIGRSRPANLLLQRCLGWRGAWGAALRAAQ